MSIEKASEEHKEGSPWKIVERFLTFEEADRRRNELLEEENLQVRVKWLRSATQKIYAVKTRTDPSLLLQEEAAVRRAEKKRRKVKLNKKRRKK